MTLTLKEDALNELSLDRSHLEKQLKKYLSCQIPNTISHKEIKEDCEQKIDNLLVNKMNKINTNNERVTKDSKLDAKNKEILLDL